MFDHKSLYTVFIIHQIEFPRDRIPHVKADMMHGLHLESDSLRPFRPVQYRRRSPQHRHPFRRRDGLKITADLQRT